jgi:hypothetical protein
MNREKDKYIHSKEKPLLIFDITYFILVLQICKIEVVKSDIERSGVVCHSTTSRHPVTIPFFKLNHLNLSQFGF